MNYENFSTEQGFGSGVMRTALAHAERGHAVRETAGKVEAYAPPQGKDAGEDRNLVDTAVRRARAKGNQLAYTFLANGTEEAGSFTYAQLDVAAREIAAGLRRAAQPGDRALLVYETGLDFVSAFYACLYAGIIAVPVPAPETSRLAATRRRLNSVLEDCNPRLLLGTGRTLELLRECDIHTGVGLQWMNTAQFAGGSTIEPVSVQGDTIAYLQYTSGSTGSPRGVVVTHENLVYHLAQIKEALEYDESSVSVCWTPHFHDYALVEGYLLPLFNGTPAYFMAPFAFLKRPASWLEAIGRYSATHSHSPSFGYRYCVRRVTTEQQTRLDLSSWRSAGCGAEPIHPSIPQEFYSTFSSCGLRRQTLLPAYGLAEATLMVTMTPMSEGASVGRFAPAALAQGKAILLTDGEDATQAVVSCGTVVPGTEVAIVDAASRRRLGTQQIGEIWVRSAGVAQGYWGRPQETEETFHASIVGETGLSFLRTGDMGFLHDGRLYVTSRMKDLIIVHGGNYHPQDIEWAVQRAHPALRQDHGAAFSIQKDCEERLCVVQEIERRQYSDEEFEQIFSSVLQAVHDDCGVVPHAVVLIKWASLPKTSSGKVQRARARQDYLSGSLKVIRSWSAEATSPPRSVCGAKPAATLPCNDVTAPPDDRSVQKADELLSWMRHYAETRINSRLIDERRCVPPYIILDFGNQGLFGLQAPTAYGGLELRHADAVRVYQQLGAIDITLATCVFLHNVNGVLPILRFAPQALREEILPRLIAGRELAAFALTEPEAGSNLGGLQARAVRDGDQGWSLYGLKRWNGSAWAGVISVFVRTPDHEGRMRGLSGFVIRQSQPGLRMGPEALTMGVRGIMQNTLYLEGVQVSGKCMLGELGQGAQVVGHVLSHGRIATAAIAVGAMQRCAQLLLRYTTRREIATGLLLDCPQTTVKISEVVHRIAISRQLLSHYAAMLDRGDPVNPDIGMALKVCATDALNFAADLLVQLLGGRGYMENNLAPQIFRDARLLSIGEGANEALVAALGRGVRLTDSVYTYLGDVGGDALAQQLVELRKLVERAGVPESCAATAVQAWRDSLLGRLTCALLDLGAAQTLAARTADHQATLRWARLRFEQQCHLAASGAGAEAVLPVEQIHQEIDSYRSNIGDVEPLAPDVEFSLDPLLRRDANGKDAEGGRHEACAGSIAGSGGV
jgi:acyl-CoA synthetase (AMP-forming)/AMP-acid ligase II/alkylation response protein AidB-like acyl-CoA dehydrogenase